MAVTANEVPQRFVGAVVLDVLGEDIGLAAEWAVVARYERLVLGVFGSYFQIALFQT